MSNDSSDARKKFSELRTDPATSADVGFCDDPDDPDASIKYDTGKARFDLIPPEAIERLAELYAHGAEKYRENNWKKGGPWGRYYAAMQRHMHAYWAGESIDPDSGFPHMVHVMWNAVALLHFEGNNIGTDDRDYG